MDSPIANSWVKMGGWGRDRPSCGSHHPSGLSSLQPHSFTSEDGVQETSFFPTLSQEAGRAGRRVERKYSWSTRPRRRQDGSLVSSGNYCHCVTLDRPHFIWAAAVSGHKVSDMIRVRE